jgi:hypothetical protein
MVEGNKKVHFFARKVRKKYVFQAFTSDTRARGRTIRLRGTRDSWHTCRMETAGHIRTRRYLRQHRMTGAELAERAELAPMQIYHLLCGRRRASLGVAVALEQATGGAILPRHWVQDAKTELAIPF